MSKPSIVFMGTPEFAVPSLEILIRHEYPIVGVITQPDRPRGRGQTITATPVKAIAEQHDLVVLQPEKVKDPGFLDIFRNISPDLVVVAAFGQILPREMIESPPMGCINVHPSLLPKYRGAAPINWALIRGETKTGVTIMMMNEGLDTGDILLQEETIIGPEETFGILHDRLAKMGAELLLKTIEMMQNDTITPIAQDNAFATYAPKIKKEDGCIHWDSDVHNIVNLIRGLSPIPCAYTFFKGKKMKVFSSAGEVAAITGHVGDIEKEIAQGLPVVTKNGVVYLKDVQLEGKKRMSIHDFLRGLAILPGDKLG